VIYLGLFWTGLSHLLKSTTTTTTTTTLHAMRTSAVAMNPLFRIATLGVGILVFLTALSGAFVAGLDAGFNHFFHFLSLTCLFFF
jgi:cytochrome c oxidase assembly protein subunit 15